MKRKNKNAKKNRRVSKKNAKPKRRKLVGSTKRSSRSSPTKKKFPKRKTKPTTRAVSKAQKLGALKRRKTYTKRTKENSYSIFRASDEKFVNHHNKIFKLETPLDDLEDFFPLIEEKFKKLFSARERKQAQSLLVEARGPVSYYDENDERIEKIKLGVHSRGKNKGEDRFLDVRTAWVSHFGDNADSPVNISEALRKLLQNIQKTLTTGGTSLRAKHATDVFYLIKEIQISLRSPTKKRKYRETEFSKTFIRRKRKKRKT